MRIPCRHLKVKPIAGLSILPFLAMLSSVRADVVYSFGHVIDVPQCYPVINNGGTVAFAGFVAGQGGGVFSSSNGTLTKIGTNPVPGSFPTVWINNAGQVSYENHSGSSFLFVRGSGGPLTTIGTAVGGLGQQVCVVSDDGTVTALNVTTTPGGTPTSVTIFSGNGGATTTVLPASSLNSSAQYGNGPFEGLAVSHNGTLVYEVFPNGGSITAHQVITSKAGVNTVVATIPDVGITGVTSVAVNNAGVVALSADFGSNSGIYLADGTNLIDVALDAPTFYASLDGGSAVSINNLSQVAFHGYSGSSAGSVFNGIYTGADPIHNKIIQTGDALGGSTVTNLAFGNDALNDSGQVVFWAQLANGTSGVFTGTPVPEPASLAIMLAGMGLLTRRRR